LGPLFVRLVSALSANLSSSLLHAHPGPNLLSDLIASDLGGAAYEAVDGERRYVPYGSGSAELGVDDPPMQLPGRYRLIGTGRYVTVCRSRGGSYSVFRGNGDSARRLMLG
jgi:hypothetical protein